MSHFEKIASVLAFSIAAGIAAVGCAAPSGDDMDDEECVDQGDQLKGGVIEKGGGFSKVPMTEAPTKQYAPVQAPTKEYAPIPAAPTKQYSPVQAPTKEYAPIQAPTKQYSPVQAPTKEYAPIPAAPTKQYAPVQAPTKQYAPVQAPNVQAPTPGLSAVPEQGNLEIGGIQ